VSGPGAGRGASRVRAFALAALVLLVVAALDQASKAAVLASLPPGEPESVFFGLELSISRNTGIAFGALAGAGGLLIGALVAVAVAALVVFFAARADRPLLWLPVGMVLGGAAGNLIDRARTGAVTDFIDPILWPAFNLADMSIVLGVLGVLYIGEGCESSPASAPQDGEAGDGAPGTTGPSAEADVAAPPQVPAGRRRPGSESTPCHDSS